MVGLAVFGGLWALSEALIGVLDLEVDRLLSYAIILAVSVVCAIGRAAYAYINACPAGLEGEPASVRRIAQLQRRRWEVRLIRESLQGELGELDTTLDDLLKGREYVPIDEQPSLTEYFDWVRRRPANALRMVAVAEALLTEDLPSVLAGREDAPPDPAAMLRFTQRVARLYEATVAFERKSHSVLPPDPCQHLHELHKGWTAPVRNGIQQLFAFIDRTLAVDLPATDPGKPLSFVFEFGELPHVEEFCAELARLEHQLPDLLRREFGANLF